MLTNSFGTNYVFDEHEDFEQYSSFEIPSEIISRYSYPASLVNQNEIPIELYYQRTNLKLIMILTSMEVLVNMTRKQYRPR